MILQNSHHLNNDVTHPFFFGFKHQLIDLADKM